MKPHIKLYSNLTNVNTMAQIDKLFQRPERPMITQQQPLHPQPVHRDDDVHRAHRGHRDDDEYDQPQHAKNLDLFQQDDLWNDVFTRISEKPVAQEWQKQLVDLFRRYLSFDEFTTVNATVLSARLNISREKLNLSIEMLMQNQFLIKGPRGRLASYKLGDAARDE